MINAIILGIVFSLLGFIFSLVFTRMSLKKKDWLDFSIIYWISVGLKFVLLFMGLLLAIFTFGIERTPLLLSFIISYLFFLIIEIIYLNKFK